MSEATQFLSIKQNLEDAEKKRNQTSLGASLKELFQIHKNATFDLLLETKLGETLNRIRKLEWCDSNSVSAMVSILSHWKAIIKNSKKSNTSSVENQKSDVRTVSINLFIEALSVDSENIPKSTIKERAKGIENVIYESFSSSVNAAYQEKVRDRFFNLKRNSIVRQNILNGDLNVVAFVSMSPAQLASEKQRELDTGLQRQNLLDAKAVSDNAAETDQFKCGRCKQRKCKYYQLQTRSADEPMTTFVTCVNCGNRWKFC